MMILRSAAALTLLATLGACSVYRDATSTTIPTDSSWRSVATDDDRQRLRGWRQAWTEALDKARIANPGAIAAEPFLFDPDRALPGAMPAPGTYRCRTFKLGAANSGLLDYVAYPWFQCRVTDAGEVRSFHRVDGSQRPTGMIFTENDARAVFLGTLVLGDETSPLRYGVDGSRDMIGYVERIGERRWRLVFPRPRFESTLDVVELVPAG